MSAIHHVDDVPGYPAPHSPYSHAVVANGFVFVSGQIPVRPGGPRTARRLVTASYTSMVASLPPAIRFVQTHAVV